MAATEVLTRLLKKMEEVGCLIKGFKAENSIVAKLCISHLLFADNICDPNIE